MNSQTPKMRLIAMFYLSVFTVALLASGVLSSQRNEAFHLVGHKAESLVTSTSSDSLPAGLNGSMEAGKNAPEVPEQDDKQDSSPLFFSFNFTSIIQWILGLPGKSISLNSEPTQPVRQSIWLSTHSLRI